MVALNLWAVCIAAAAEPRNVLFIAADDMRPWLGYYGHPQARTPHLDALAASGVRFDSAHCQFALCMPSRTSLLSGVRPDEAGRQFYLASPEKLRERSFTKNNTTLRALRPEVVSLPQHLRAHGWRTVSVGKVAHDTDDRGFEQTLLGPSENAKGLDYYALPESRAKIRDRALKLPVRGIPFEAADVPEGKFNDGKVAAEAVRQLRALKAEGKPFFLGVGFFRPHLPLVAPKKYWDLYPAAGVMLPQNLAQPAGVGPLARFSGPSQVNWEHYRFPEKPDGSVDEATMRECIRGYLACQSFVDAQVGLVLDALRAEGLAESTVVMLWSDHGYHLGEHGEWSKVTNYEESTRVPLLIRDPAALHAGRVVPQPVELLDLYPTLCDLLALPKPAHLDGESLVPLLRGAAGRGRDYAVSLIPQAAVSFFPKGSTATGWSLRTTTHRYTVWFGKDLATIAQRELFDHRTDPGENQNLSAAADHAEEMQTLHDKLMREIVVPMRKAKK